MNHYSIVLDKIKDQIIQKFNPSRIILFGSVAKRIWRNNSDIDLCIIKDTDNKRDLITNMYVEVESEIPFDIVLYTDEELKVSRVVVLVLFFAVDICYNQLILSSEVADEKILDN